MSGNAAIETTIWTLILSLMIAIVIFLVVVLFTCWFTSWRGRPNINEQHGQEDVQASACNRVSIAHHCNSVCAESLV